MKWARIARRLGLDVVLWYCIPTAFLLVYVQHFDKPVTAVAPHLRTLAIPLLCLLLLRIALARATAGAGLSRLVAAVSTATLLALLILYYLLVVIGLVSWGGVVEWNVIPTFFAQSSVVTDSLHITPAVAAFLFVCVYLGLIAACRSYLVHFDWTAGFVGHLATVTFAIVMTLGTAIVAVEAYVFSLGLGSAAGEPMSLTLFHSFKEFDLEGYTVNPVVASQMDRIDDAARKAYLPAPSARRNLVLIVVDALRPDHMGIYGYDRGTTPNLSRIAGVQTTRIITNVHSSCGDTACSLYSLFSSRFPREYPLRPFTLQEALRRNGYRLHLILSGDHTYFHTIKYIYGPVDTFYDGTQARDRFLNDDRLVIDRLAAMPPWDGAPVMFQFHLMSAHITRKSDVVPGKFQPAVRYVFHNSHDTGAGGAPLETAVNFYDNGVVSADSVIADLLEMLQKKGYLGNTLVVITADHGESLGEHGLFHHANSVREELLRIPLVLISYGYQPRFPARPREFPSQVDIAPTLLAELDLPLPRSWSGRPLQQPDAPDFSYFNEQSFAGLLDHRDPNNPWKYWIDTRSGEDHVFNLRTDPHENHEARERVPEALRSDWRANSLGTSMAVATR